MKKPLPVPKWWLEVVKIEKVREAALVAEIERLRKLLELHGIESDQTH